MICPGSTAEVLVLQSYTQALSESLGSAAPLAFCFLPTSQGCAEIIQGKSLAHWLVLGLSVPREVASFKGELLTHVYALIILMKEMKRMKGIS